MCCAMFSSMAGGTLQTEKCASTAESKAVFTATSSGQLKMPGLGNFCVTVLGDGMISSDISKGAEATATSSSAQHSASNAIDGSAESYWASGLDPATAVSVDLDFGTTKIIEKVVIEWEHAPLVRLHLNSWACVIASIWQAFEIQTSASGVWDTIFATSTNNLDETKYLGPPVKGASLRIKMTQVSI